MNVNVGGMRKCVLFTTGPPRACQLRFEFPGWRRYPVLAQFLLQHGYAFGVALPAVIERPRCLDVETSARCVLNIAPIEIDKLSAVGLVAALGVSSRCQGRQSDRHKQQE